MWLAAQLALPQPPAHAPKVLSTSRGSALPSCPATYSAHTFSWKNRCQQVRTTDAPADAPRDNALHRTLAIAFQDLGQSQRQALSASTGRKGWADCSWFKPLANYNKQDADLKKWELAFDAIQDSEATLWNCFVSWLQYTFLQQQGISERTRLNTAPLEC